MRLIKALLTLSSMLLMLWDAPVSARQQTAADVATLSGFEARVEPEKEEMRAVKRQVQRDPLVRSGLTLPEPQLSFETTTGKGRATGTIGVVYPRPGGEQTFLFTVSSPVGDSGEAQVRPLDLRALADAGSIRVAFSGARMFRRFSVADIRRLCTGLAKEDCTAGKLEEKNPQLSQQLLATVFRRLPLLYAATFTYGRNEFSFFDQVGVQQTPVERNDVQAEGTLGLLVNRRTNLLAFHAAYAQTHNASSDTTQLCRPLPGSIIMRCDRATVGEPTRTRTAIGTIEYRIQFAGERRVPIALAPKLQFALGLDVADDVSSIEVPIYFFQEKVDASSASTAPKLNGGVSAGWRSDEGFQVSVFIGTTFKLLKISTLLPRPDSQRGQRAWTTSRIDLASPEHLTVRIERTPRG